MTSVTELRPRPRSLTMRVVVMSARLTLPIALALSLPLLGPAAAAAERPALVYQSLLVARVNPLGLEERFSIGYRAPLYDSDAMLLQDGLLEAGLAASLSPADTKIGVQARVKPLAILELGVRWDWVGYFGSFDLVQSSPDTGRIRDRAGAGTYAANGWQLTAWALVQAKVGPVALRSQLNAMYVQMDLRRGDTVWYASNLDLVVPGAGWVLVQDTDLLFLIGDHVIAGARYTFSHPIFDRASLPPTGHPGDAEVEGHKVGPFFAYRFYSEPGAAFDAPTIVALVQWHAKHFWRPDGVIHPAVPTFVLGFAFGGQVAGGG